MTNLAAGQHVIIANRDHPWYGFTGTIDGPFSAVLAGDLDWSVKLDAAGCGGLVCACATGDLRRVEDL